ncbi:uncharacterized protein LOC142608698 [Castanea sativa]|uniref:uncharacterized protein LOC142608698 n=1 Tax=Castanea sativa TaxID=21020 RepID=UPI003F64F5A0
MTETQATAMNTVNIAIASLCTTSDHHKKDIQEIQKIQSIHTSTLNKMNKNINVILQKLNSIDGNQHLPQRNVQPNSIPNSSTLSLANSVKLDFPRFSGVDPASWVYKANQYFGYYQTPIAEKLIIASFHKELEALALHERFGSTTYDDPMEVLTRLRQTTTVALYKAEFEAVSNRIMGLSPMHKLSCFLSGLKDEIRLSVRMLNPQSLNAAFGLAKIQEEYVMSCRRNVKN